MTEINLNPTKSTISVQITSQSLHVLGFVITVYEPDKNTIIEELSGDTKNENPFTKALELKPSDSEGKYISGTFTFMSPDGKDYPYSAIFSILEDKNIILPNINVSGVTMNGSGSNIKTFHVNNTLQI